MEKKLTQAAQELIDEQAAQELTDGKTVQELTDEQAEQAAGGGVSTQILSQVAARVIAEAIEKEKRRQAMS